MIDAEIIKLDRDFTSDGLDCPESIDDSKYRVRQDSCNLNRVSHYSIHAVCVSVWLCLFGRVGYCKIGPTKPKWKIYWKVANNKQQKLHHQPKVITVENVIRFRSNNPFPISFRLLMFLMVACLRGLWTALTVWRVPISFRFFFQSHLLGYLLGRPTPTSCISAVQYRQCCTCRCLCVPVQYARYYLFRLPMKCDVVCCARQQMLQHLQ